MRGYQPHAKIYAFEANPRVFQKFSEKNISAGVDYRNIAIGQEVKSAILHIPDQIANTPVPFVSRMASLKVITSRDSRTTSVEVEMLPLDAAISAIAKDDRCALRIEVEGAIDQVLDGARKTLEVTDVIVCQIERAAVWKDQVLDDHVRGRLKEAGFRIVARDCHKYFQYHAVFLRESVLAADTGLIDLVKRFEDQAYATWSACVPPTIFQYWDTEQRPREVYEAMMTWEKDPEFVYRRFDRDSAEAVVRSHFPERVLIAFQSCRVPAMQADLFRLCVLYAFGGIYIDADIKNLGTNDLLLKSGGRGFLFHRGGRLANDLMALRHRFDPLIGYALDRVVANIEKRMAAPVWAVSGPGILTEAFERLGPNDELFKGFVLETVHTVRLLFGFEWHMDYKKLDTHWTNVDPADLYFPLSQ
jgi:FkbM family methyltransferase